MIQGSHCACVMHWYTCLSSHAVHIRYGLYVSGAHHVCFGGLSCEECQFFI